MILLKVSKYILIGSIIASVSILVLSIFSLSKEAHSQSVEEIEKEIAQQEEKLSNTQKEIDSLENQLTNASKKLESASDGLPKIEAELKELETQLEINKKTLQLLEEANQLKEIEKKRLEALQEKSIKDVYKIWKIEENKYGALFESRTDYKRAEFYGRVIFGVGNEMVDGISAELDELESEIGNSEQIVSELEKQNEELESKKTELKNEIQRLNSVIANGQGSIAGLKTRQESLQNTITNLLAEQKEAASREAEILNNTPNNPGNGGDGSGDLYFTGRGRDLYQGHGVGMSQWGAYGAGLSGWSAEQILSFYYKSTNIQTRAANISVQGYGTMSADKYVAGLGEVPDRACGTAAQAAERPDKYVQDNPNTVWDCWPEEAIKAQVIAARSYAINYGGTICTTAACQVYTGGTAKQWAADETSNLVIVSTGSTDNGQVIEALYSSDNSQGSGTANNDTIFQNFQGNGTPYSYLRAANDSSFATKTSWTNWTYQTGTYSYQSIWNMFDFIANNPASGASSSMKSNIRSMISGANGVKSISFERDPSARVKKVWVTFDNNVVKSIGGWWFKNAWNNWAYDTGTYDYIYSQTFYLN